MGLIILITVIPALCVTFANADCGVIPMRQWAGTESNRVEVMPEPVGLAVIQHTVTGTCATDSECERIINVIRNSQMNHQFTDIGYSFVIGGNGKVYEGAGWNRVGAHTRGYNSKSIGIAFIGNFHEQLPNPESIQAAQQLLKCGAENGHLSSNYHLVGHRQLSPTISPGDALQGEIESWPHFTKTL